MISYDQALERLLARARRLPAESRTPVDALGCVLARDVVSPIDLPSFNHAAMDGYALRAREPLAAGSEHAVVGSQAAGDAAPASSGNACEIMTGARLPADLDAVVAVERTQLLARGDDGMPARIRLLDALAVGDNVRYAGSDVARGAVVAVAGTRIDPAHVMLLAALGVTSVEVVRRPRVAIIGTGKELLADPTRPLADEQIHSSNGPYLMAALAASSVQVLSCETLDDTASHYRDAVLRARDAGADLIVSTGAVSMGRHDFVPDALQALGAELLFHQVAMRPGKPVLAAMLGDDTLVLALPGTPMAVAVGFRFFVAPVLRAWAGQGSEVVLHAVLDTPQQPKPGLRHFLRARLSQGRDGRLHASLLKLQQPFRIQPFAEADAWVVLGEGAGDCLPGMLVEIVSLHPGVPLRIGTSGDSN
ncbi:molybdopterin molybdotransferase MoeA [Dyella halodurans]|uniref:Molybdopterin molybdenumtransferase n=1 Tax=Dyella halodurans TaxID=1920171 RepID=A0ABV9C3E6_9GAMM|nr:gephyrin-like molybdotransferase Glp [Dyella halodurans]